MSEISSSTAATGTSYVFVKLQGKNVKRAAGAKRVLIPGSLQTFRKACQNIFKLDVLIKAFYNSENNFIHSVSELEPGTTIIASTDEPEGEDANFDFESTQKQKVVRYFDPSAPLMYAEYPQKKKVSLGKAPKCMVVGFPEALTVDQANLRLKSKKVPATSGTTSERTSRLSSSFARRSPLGDAQNDGQGNGGNLNQNQNPNQNFHFFDQTSYTFVSSDAGTMSTVSTRPQRIEPKKQALSKTRLDKTMLLLSKLFSQQELELLKQVNQAFKGLPDKKRQFISGTDQNEADQRINWIKAMFDILSNLHFCEKTTGLFLQEEINEYVKQSVIQHRYISGGFGGHRFNTAIVGPPKSGKSTILEIYAREIVTDLSTCSDWKTSFIFPFDMKEMAPEVHDVKGFYIYIVKMVCDLIAKQKPAYLRLIPDIRRYFESLVTDPTKLVLQKSYLESTIIKRVTFNLNSIGDDIVYTWRNPIAFENWINLIFELPILIPRALGFRKTIFIIDNIDYCDIRLEPVSPFTESTRMAFISEHLKYALSQSDYIFACYDLKKMFEIMISIDQEGVDLLATTDFLPTNGIASDVVENDPPLVVSLTTQDVPFVMKGADCDGVPNYIMLWRDLNQSIDERDALQEGSDEYEEIKYFTIAYAQNIINLMFFSSDADYTDNEESNWPHVLSIHRSTDSENEQLNQEEINNQQQIQNEIQAIPIEEVENDDIVAEPIEVYDDNQIDRPIPVDENGEEIEEVDIGSNTDDSNANISDGNNDDDIGDDDDEINNMLIDGASPVDFNED